LLNVKLVGASRNK